MGVLRGVPAVLFAFFGFESIMSLSRVARNPSRTIPIATVLTILVVGLIYIAFVGLVIAGVPQEYLLTKGSLSEALLYATPDAQWMVHLINASIIVTVLGTVYALVWSLSELLISCVSKVSHERLRLSETLSLVIIGVGMAASMTLCQNMASAFAWVALCVVAVYMLSLAALVCKGRSALERVIGLGALAASGLIFACAVVQLI